MGEKVVAILTSHLSLIGNTHKCQRHESQPVGLQFQKNPAAWLDAMCGEDRYPIKALITGNNPLTLWPDVNKARKAVSSLELVVHMDLFKNATSDHADYVCQWRAVSKKVARHDLQKTAASSGMISLSNHQVTQSRTIGSGLN